MASPQSAYITNKIKIDQSLEQQAENSCPGGSVQFMVTSNTKWLGLLGKQ